ncbi:hypothetical protein MRB53_034199 [Persea americana]|uniref:Uncharacterized protein n=1 Tax=Persea americana TaxID=3435 RepID=A0ACC2KWT2_PERAE|nr:hypothetical protein MRB53_034199 [Persea americana]
MAISQRSNNLLFSPSIFSRLQTLISDLRRSKHTFAGEEGEISPIGKDAALDSVITKNVDRLDTSTWKVMDSRRAGINWSKISPSTQMVLKILQRKGFDTYLVGGCVRDLLLKKTPKDFDVVTTASLKQVKKQFHRSQIVGRRFPICLVKIYDNTVEVSSFDTIAKHSKEKETVGFSQMPTGCDKKDFVRWKNCMERDFTINGLLYDPFVNRIYDYTGGIMDLKMCKVRTVIPAYVSFKEDCARILRALRIAARLGLHFSRDTAAAMCNLSSSIVKLEKSRLMMEMNFMLAYGAAESSLCLLHRFRLLDIMLPVHGAYLAEQAEKKVAQSSTMFMKLFSCVDKLLAPDRPSDCSLWVGLLAFHLALINHPQDPLVVWTFASNLYYGNWCKAVEFARENAKMGVQFSPEILEMSATESDESLLEEVSHLASLVISSIDALTNTDALLKTMGRYPHLPHLGLVFISKKTATVVSEHFSVIEADVKHQVVERENFDVDYKLLERGEPNETRFVLGKVIMDTMNNGVLQDQNVEVVKKQRIVQW